MCARRRIHRVRDGYAAARCDTSEFACALVQDGGAAYATSGGIITIKDSIIARCSATRVSRDARCGTRGAGGPSALVLPHCYHGWREDCRGQHLWLLGTCGHQRE